MSEVTWDKIHLRADAEERDFFWCQTHWIAQDEDSERMAEIIRTALNRCGPLARVELRGHTVAVEGAGRDNRCGFCSWYKKAFADQLGLVDYRTDCHFERPLGWKQPVRSEPGDALIGKTLVVRDLEYDEVCRFTVTAQRADPTNGLITAGTPIAREVARLNKSGHEPGTVFECRDTTYELLEVSDEGAAPDPGESGGRSQQPFSG